MNSIKCRLQITIVTYNRSKYLKRTLDCITSNDSPIRDFDILILDNNSSDDTVSVVKTFQERFNNIKYRKNPYNIGAPANIARALECNEKDYLWILADDDVYFWNNWKEVELAINNNEKAIVVSRMDLPDNLKNDVGQILYQSAFNAAVIYSKAILNDTVFHNMYNNIDTMFPHLIPLVFNLNSGGNFYILKEQIVKHGFYENEASSDASYIRGTDDKNICSKLKKMSFVVGFCNVISDLDDENLKEHTIVRLFESVGNLFNKNNYYKEVIRDYSYDLIFLSQLYLNADDKIAKAAGIQLLRLFSLKSLILVVLEKLSLLQKCLKFFNKNYQKLFAYKVLSCITCGNLKQKFIDKKMKYSNRVKVN